MGMLVKSIPSDVLLMATENPVTVLLSTVSEKSLELKLPPLPTWMSSLNVMEKEVPADGTAVELLYVGAVVSAVTVIAFPLTDGDALTELLDEPSVNVKLNDMSPLSPLAISYSIVTVKPLDVVPLTLVLILLELPEPEPILTEGAGEDCSTLQAVASVIEEI